MHQQQLRKNDKVVMWLASANHDPLVFENPGSIDLNRSPNPHVTFGRGGPHFCLGASLAQLEMRVFLEEFVQRVKSVHLAGEAVRLRSNFINGFKQLPVRIVRYCR